MTSTIETEDVVARLRSWPAITQGDALSASTVALLMEDAADTIERLREENARLRNELLWYATKLPHADYRHHAQRALGL
jgi:hypothetical protein